MSSLFDLINIPFSYVIKFFYSISGSYMLALFGFALVVKVVLFPVGIKSQKNMVKQASLRPREMAIRAKYAGRTDQATQQKMQQEVMALYQSENYNPAAGCLPLIVQLIVVWAIYKIVYGPLTYLCSMSADCLIYVKEAVMHLQNPEMAIEELSKFVGNEIQLLNQVNTFGMKAVVDAMSAIGHAGADIIAEAQNILGNLPNLTAFGFNLAATPMEGFPDLLLLIPVLNLVTTLGSTKITRKLSYQAPSQADQAGASMKIMEYAMPLMIAWMAFTFPAALGVYWIFQNILGIVQQFILSKMYPYPTFTEEEMKAAERAINGKAKKEKKADEQKAIRSLHHIDDEDDDPAAKKQISANTGIAGTRYDREDEEKAEDAPTADSVVPPAPLKSEKDKKRK